MNYYYGIRPTGSNLHIGHVMSLLNMFDNIRKNKNEISNIYILLAESHAEISTCSTDTIRSNATTLANRIYALFSAYLKWHDLPSMLGKLNFIYQNDIVGILHRDITYKFLPILNSNDVLTNPIYTNSDNNSVGFLLYPVLQSFDVMLYAEPEEELVVFVSGDQRANINIMKDICTKLKFPCKISYKVYDNVIYDNKNKHKMSKSLGNFVDFDDSKSWMEFIKQHITYPRPKKSDCGEHLKCPFYYNVIHQIKTSLNADFDFLSQCDTGEIGCYKCKMNVYDTICNFVDLYNDIYINEDSAILTCNTAEVRQKYLKIVDLINNVRSTNENC